MSRQCSVDDTSSDDSVMSRQYSVDYTNSDNSENKDSSTSSGEVQEGTSRGALLSVSVEKPSEVVPVTLRQRSTDCTSSNDSEGEDSSNNVIQETSSVELSDILGNETLVMEESSKSSAEFQHEAIEKAEISDISGIKATERKLTTSAQCSEDFSEGKENESSKSNIEEENLNTEASSAPCEHISAISTSNPDESGLRAHREKLVILHKELQQFHFALKVIKSSKIALKDSSPEKKTSGSSQSDECSKPLIKSINKYSSNLELPLTAKYSSASLELKESELASPVSFHPTSDTAIESSESTSSSLPSTSSNLPINSEIQRVTEAIHSAPFESRNVPSPLEIPPVDPMPREDYESDNDESDNDESDNDELNGVISRNFAGSQYVMNIIPLFEVLQNDLLEVKAFLDGTGQASCDSGENPDYGPTLDERLLASIPEEFGTGVESTAAENSRTMLSIWEHRVQPVDQAAAVGRSDEALATECEIPRESGNAAEQGTSVESTQSESTSTTASCSQDQPAETQPGPSLDSRLEALSNSSDVSRQLLRLNRIARRQLNHCIRTTREVISYCVTGTPHLFLPRLEILVAEILNVLHRLVVLRQECSALLRRCRNREDTKGVTYILKVKTQIAAAYNSLLHNILTLNSNFNATSIKNIET